MQPGISSMQPHAQPMQTYVLIDWIAATIPVNFSSYAAMADRLSGLFPTPAHTYVLSKPMHGYRLAILEPYGILAMSGGNDGMGTHVILSGSTLNKLNDAGFPRMSAIENLARAKARFSRIDLACDVHQSPIMPNDIFGALETGNAKSKLKRYRHMKGDDGGSTLYLGSPKSEKMFRFYDKGVESGSGEPYYMRIEAQLSGALAHRASSAIMQNSLEDVTMTLIRESLQLNHDNWTEIVESTPAGIAPSTRKVTNTKQWLETVVAKTLAEIMRVEPEYSTVFWDKVTEAIAESRK